MAGLVTTMSVLVFLVLDFRCYPPLVTTTCCIRKDHNLSNSVIAIATETGVYRLLRCGYRCRRLKDYTLETEIDD
jgi:hypothetical protein